MSKNKSSRKINTKFIYILIAVVVLGGGFGLYKYFRSLAHEITDDAQIESNLSPVIPKVSGYIKKIYVQDNQEVQKGDTLFVIDDSDYKIRVEQAEAALLAAKGNLNVAHAGVSSSNSNIITSQAGANAAMASVSTAQANIEAAKVQLWRAQNDFERYSKLYESQSITKQQYEQALAAKETAEKQLNILQEQKNVAEKQARQVAEQVNSTRSQTKISESQIDVANANIKKAEADLENAKLNLSYTVVTAPETGKISKLNLQEGQLVQAGQALFSFVPKESAWIVANFKETQMEFIRPGQTVDIKVDAFPSHKFTGKVNSISPATGAKFALLPPDNASGNFVKTVQRVPVKITFENQNDEALKLLRPGMNVIVDVNIKETRKAEH
jgi:membrane fusion protein (multidrug efflux system)